MRWAVGDTKSIDMKMTEAYYLRRKRKYIEECSECGVVTRVPFGLRHKVCGMPPNCLAIFLAISLNITRKNCVVVEK
jgi:ssDNA-binding Zn-finger/Zn-ribbon topoisomerase 1